MTAAVSNRAAGAGAVRPADSSAPDAATSTRSTTLRGQYCIKYIATPQFTTSGVQTMPVLRSTVNNHSSR